jgi:hypothetical protein
LVWHFYHSRLYPLVRDYKFGLSIAPMSSLKSNFVCRKVPHLFHRHIQKLSHILIQYC